MYFLNKVIMYVYNMYYMHFNDFGLLVIRLIGTVG